MELIKMKTIPLKIERWKRIKDNLLTLPKIISLVLHTDLTHRLPEEHETVDDQEADDYINGCDFPENSDYAITAAEIESHSGEIKGKVILEVGQGPGNLIEVLLEKGAKKVIGLDPSIRMTEYCLDKYFHQVRAGRMDFIKGSIYAQQLPSELVESIDLVVSENTWHQLYDPLAGLQGMVASLKPEGKGFIRDFRRDNITKQDLFRRALYSKPVIIPYVLASIGASLTKDEFAHLLKGIAEVDGFEIINAPDPKRKYPDLAEIIAKDPVPHWKDYHISQIVTFTKRR